MVDEFRISGDWDAHVTGAVFERIKEEEIDDYKKAIGGEPFQFGNHEKARINKRIGARVKRLLKADVVEEKGRRAKGQPSRKSHALVMSYSLLRPAV